MPDVHMSDVSIDKKEQYSIFKYSFYLINYSINHRKARKEAFPLFSHFPSFHAILFKESYDRDIVYNIIYIDISILHDIISSRSMIYFFKSTCKLIKE